MPPLPPTYPHPSPYTSLLPHLLPLLPSSLPLTRRLQHHLSMPHTLILATFPPHPPAAAPPSFAACWADRSRAPETECWLFSTYELPAQTHDPDDARAQILALLHAVAQARDPADRSPLLVVGSVHASLVPLLSGGDSLPAAEGVISRALHTSPSSSSSTTDPTSCPTPQTHTVIASISPSYTKFLIPPCNSQQPPPSLPQGYTFSTLQLADLPAVIASTAIPRTEATLAQLGNVCVRNGRGEVVSWGFVGLDGSLSSLYTVGGERGKGLARGVAWRLLGGLGRGEERREGAGLGDADEMGFRGVASGEGWAHADVAVGNEGSVGAMRAVGGREGWEGRWVGVDLGRVVEVVGREFGG